MSTQRKAEYGHNSNSNGALAIKAKLKATLSSARLFLLLYGSVGLVGCVGVTMLLCGWLHLDPYATLAGSFVSFVILGAATLPMKTIWKSKLISAYQEEHLFDLANELGFKDIGREVAQILDDKYPSISEPDHFILRITDLRLLFIRQGEMGKARKLSQYLYRMQPENSYNISCLASINDSLGYFDEALELALRNIDNLSSDVRTSSPAVATSCLCLISTNLYLHRTVEAQKWLERLKTVIDTKDRSKTESNVDRLVRIECNSTNVDAAFYALYLGKFQMLAKQSDARENMMKAEKFMAIEENQRRLLLFYPSIMMSLGRLSMQEGNYKPALVNFERALSLYEPTPFRGPDYHECRAFAAYCKWKNTGANAVDQIESAICSLEVEVQPNHPRLGMILVLLGEVQMRFNAVKAKQAYERAHAIYTKQYPAGDPDMCDLEQRLISMAA
jgi:tetratricopeptide (TPR) repeat protein